MSVFCFQVLPALNFTNATMEEKDKLLAEMTDVVAVNASKVSKCKDRMEIPIFRLEIWRIARLSTGHLTIYCVKLPYLRKNGK